MSENPIVMRSDLNLRYYFDAVTADVLHEGIIVPDHTSTRVGVCQTSFEWQTSDDWGPCSRECDGGIRTRLEFLIDSCFTVM